VRVGIEFQGPLDVLLAFFEAAGVEEERGEVGERFVAIRIGGERFFQDRDAFVVAP